MRACEYTNKFGERWILEYDMDAHLGYIRGSDVDWTQFPVVDGIAIGLTLDPDEVKWLACAWRTITRDQIHPGLYFDKQTEFRVDKDCCYLTNNFCPICLEQKLEFESHHCVPRSRGGSDKNINLLRISQFPFFPSSSAYEICPGGL